MSNTLKIRNTRGTVLATIPERSKNSTATSLVLHGRGNKNYGGDRDENLVHLLENFSNTTPPSNPIEGQLWWNRRARALFVFDPTGSPQESFTSVVPPPQEIGFNIIAGIGLIGGGKPDPDPPDGSPLSVTINVADGTGITVTADAVSTNDSEIIHDDLSGFDLNEHIDHSTVSIIAGDGLTGGGDLTASRTLNVGAGTGISSTADDVRVDSTVVRTTGNQTINGVKQWRAPLRGDFGSEGTPGWSFQGDTDTGFYRSDTNELSFTTGGTQRFRVESGGVLHSLNNSYENLVTQDDDIPNKKYVDDAAVGITPNPTSTVFVGSHLISGLTPGKKYLISVYGITRNKGNNVADLGQVRLSTSFAGTGTLLGATPIYSINWHDGSMSQSATFVVNSMVGTIARGYTDWTASSFPNYILALNMTAIQLN